MVGFLLWLRDLNLRRGTACGPRYISLVWFKQNVECILLLVFRNWDVFPQESGGYPAFLKHLWEQKQHCSCLLSGNSRLEMSPPTFLSSPGFRDLYSAPFPLEYCHFSLKWRSVWQNNACHVESSLEAEFLNSHDQWGILCWFSDRQFYKVGAWTCLQWIRPEAE